MCKMKKPCNSIGSAKKELDDSTEMLILTGWLEIACFKTDQYDVSVPSLYGSCA